MACVASITNESLYREEFTKNKYFYVSLLDDCHRRFQTFVQSCAFGDAEKLRHNQLHFEKICDVIELFGYSVRVPSWLSKRSRPEPTSTPSFNPQSSDGGNKRSTPNTYQSTSGEKVVNPYVDSQMRSPRNIRFSDIFNLTNRNDIKKTNHPDGQHTCNNYQAYHDKTLTPSELSAGRKYLSSLHGKFNANNNNQNPFIPNGNPPPTNSTVSTSQKNADESKKGPT